MNQTEARALAREISEWSRQPAIATQASRANGEFPKTQEPWVVETPQGFVRSREEWEAARNG